MDSAGLLLPIDQTYYGEIEAEDLDLFLSCAREALRTRGFGLLKVLNAGNDLQKELWGVGELLVEGLPLHVVTSEGKDVELDVDWLSLINCNAKGILEALNEAVNAANQNKPANPPNYPFNTFIGKEVTGVEAYDLDITPPDRNRVSSVYVFTFSDGTQQVVSLWNQYDCDAYSIATSHPTLEDLLSSESRWELMRGDFQRWDSEGSLP